jgi:hypothetical protein
MADTFGEPEREPAALNAAGRDTFVIRIWSSDGSDALRGHIQHVRSRKRAYFATRQRLLSFIQDHLEHASPRSLGEG